MTAIRGVPPDSLPLLYGKVMVLMCRKTGHERPRSGRWDDQAFYHAFGPDADAGIEHRRSGSIVVEPTVAGADSDVEEYGLPKGTVLRLPTGEDVTLGADCLLLISRDGNDLWQLS